MKKLLIIAFFVITACQPVSKRPDIYIISVNKYLDIESRDRWVLSYAINGEVQQAVFPASGGCENYIEYLGTIGDIR